MVGMSCACVTNVCYHVLLHIMDGDDNGEVDGDLDSEV